MHLPYSTRSKFFAPIEAALAAVGNRLDEPLTITLEPLGYSRDAVVEIGAGGERTFWTDWESQHPTRFSARVRAAATVLKRRGLSGHFRIVHENGSMRIERA